MSPIEDKAFGRAGMRSKVGHDRLNEAKDCRNDTDDSMRIGTYWQGSPSSQFDKNQNEGDYRQHPGDCHQHSMELI